MKFAGFQCIDPGKNIGVPVDWIDTVPLGGSDEREVHGNGLCTFVGARKKTIFPHKNPGFNSPLCLIVVDCDVRILEKSCQCSPMLESIVNCFHQLVSGIEVSFCTDDDTSETFYKRFRFFSAHCQPERCWLIPDIPFDFVEVSVDIQDQVANHLLGKFGFKIFSPRMSIATGFDSLPVFEQCVESTGSVCLNDAAEIFEEREIFVERKVGRIVEHVHRMPRIANVGSYFPFADIVFVLPILDFNRGVVSLYDAGREEILLQQFIQERKRVGGSLHPVTLSRAGNRNVVTGKDFFLTIVGKTVVELADDYFPEKSRTGIATRNRCAGFFCRNDVLLAARAGTSFLQVIEDLQAGTHHFELMGKQVADENRFDGTIGADSIFWFYRMRNWFVRKIFGIVQNVLDADGSFIFGGWICFWLRSSWARVVFFRLFAVVALISFFRLSDQDIKLRLEVFEQLALLFVSIQSLFELSLQLFNQLCEALNLGLRIKVFLLQPVKIFFHEAPLVISGRLYTICYRCIRKKRMTPYLMPGKIRECLRMVHYVSFGHGRKYQPVAILLSGARNWYF